MKDGVRDIDVAVCIPHMGMMQAETAVSLAGLFGHFAQWKPPPAFRIKRKQLRLLTHASSILPTSRFLLAKSAMKAGCTHILFIDSDMKFPKDTLQRLLLRGKKVIAVNATTRTFPTKFLAEDESGVTYDSRRLTGVAPARHIGFGVALIEMDVLRRMKPPIFMFEWIPELQDLCGEDVYFSAKLAELGITPYVDHDLSKEIGHVGKWTYGPWNVEEEVSFK